MHRIILIAMLVMPQLASAQNWRMDSVEQIQSIGLKSMLVLETDSKNTTTDTVWMQFFDKSGRTVMERNNAMFGTLDTRMYKFDKKGQLLSDVHLSPYGDSMKVFVYTYENDLPTLKVERGQGTYTKKEKMMYDGNGLMLNHDFYMGEQLSRSIQYAYNQSGKPTVTECNSSSGQPIYVVHSTYDGEGRLIAERQDVGNKSTQVNYTYDDNGLLIAKSTTDNEGSSLDYVYTYSSEQHLLTEKFSNHEGFSSVKRYTYDKQNRLTSLKYSSNEDEEFSEFKYFYDEGKLPSKMVYFASDKSGKSILQEVLYNKMGQPTQEKHLDVKTNEMLYLRTYTYQNGLLETLTINNPRAEVYSRYKVIYHYLKN